MRRKDREMSKEFGQRIIDESEYGVLSVSMDTYPSSLPLSLVRDKDVLYFHGAKAGEKVGIYAENENVTVVFVGEVEVPNVLKPDDIDRLVDEGHVGEILRKVYTTQFESAIVRGKISQVTDDKEKVHALRLICEKYTPEKMKHFEKAANFSLGVTGVYKVQIEELTAKRKKYGPDGNTLPSDLAK